MSIQESCGPCFDKQVHTLELAAGRRTILCPMLALLALNADHRTPPVERHFLNLAEECKTETYGEGGLYTTQQVQGERAVSALVAIKRAQGDVEHPDFATAELAA